jgi:chromate transporter
MSDDDPLLALVMVFAPLSLLAIGGGGSLLGDIQQQVVVNHGWMTAQEFQEAFAISRVSPGPGILIVTLIGWHVAGWLGAVLATAAIILPSSVLIYGLAHVWHSGRRTRWQKALSRGLAPIAAGLIIASVIRLLAYPGGPPVAWLVAGGVALLAFSTRVSQILLLGAGAVIFVGSLLLMAAAGGSALAP